MYLENSTVLSQHVVAQHVALKELLESVTFDIDTRTQLSKASSQRFILCSQNNNKNPQLLVSLGLEVRVSGRLLLVIVPRSWFITCEVQVEFTLLNAFEWNEVDSKCIVCNVDFIVMFETHRGVCGEGSHVLHKVPCEIT